MSSRRTRLVIAGIAALGVVGMAMPAQAGDTDVTFTLTGGDLTITTPTAAATLSAGALSVTGTSVTGALGDTTVTDERGSLLQNVTVTMASSAFTNDPNPDPAVTGDEYVIPASAATGYSGVATPSGTAIPVPTTVGMALGGSGSAILTMESSGSGGAIYNPTVSVAVPAGAIAGTYEGVITQTVA
jgi:hypothetical protein